MAQRRNATLLPASVTMISVADELLGGMARRVQLQRRMEHIESQGEQVVQRQQQGAYRLALCVVKTVRGEAGLADGKRSAVGCSGVMSRGQSYP